MVPVKVQVPVVAAQVPVVAAQVPVVAAQMQPVVAPQLNIVKPSTPYEINKLFNEMKNSKKPFMTITMKAPPKSSIFPDPFSLFDDNNRYLCANSSTKTHTQRISTRQSIAVHQNFTCWPIFHVPLDNILCTKCQSNWRAFSASFIPITYISMHAFLINDLLIDAPTEQYTDWQIKYTIFLRLLLFFKFHSQFDRSFTDRR